MSIGYDVVSVETPKNHSNIKDFQEFINKVMWKIINESNCDNKKALDILYKECHPCVTSIFSSSAEFLLKMTAVVDYILQLVPKLMSFKLKEVININGVYLYIGKNNHETDVVEVWAFLSSKKGKGPSLDDNIQLVLNSLHPSNPWCCFLYDLETGDLNALHSPH
ncbi:hypothetical protein J2S74_001365 [Evansella vedderi]|uniref:Uncharacterized protein n=1 Tax=Evansella vedderi TaxID=38282 RepID=A0ABT9ZTB8_9BACI|nr:hypothetical protein [Evansella vedderi]MDQ0253992.1 hypothetical protein [Evansella vedderi]